MKIQLILKCRCGDWFTALVPNQHVASVAQCSACGQTQAYDLKHLGQGARSSDVFMLASQLNADRYELTDAVSSCTQADADHITDRNFRVVMDSGAEYENFSGLLATQDSDGVLEHLGVYSEGQCTRGLWMHQYSRFLHYRSKTSEVIYIRGMVNGLPLPCIDPSRVYATKLSYSRLRDKCLARFRTRAHIRARDLVFEYPPTESDSVS